MTEGADSQKELWTRSTFECPTWAWQSRFQEWNNREIKSSRDEAFGRMSWRKRDQLGRSLINIWFYQVSWRSSAFYRSWTIRRGLFLAPHLDTETKIHPGSYNSGTLRAKSRLPHLSFISQSTNLQQELPLSKTELLTRLGKGDSWKTDCLYHWRGLHFVWYEMKLTTCVPMLPPALEPGIRELLLLLQNYCNMRQKKRENHM